MPKEQKFATKKEAVESWRRQIIAGFTKMLDGIADEDLDGVTKLSGVDAFDSKSKQEQIQFVTDAVTNKGITEVFFMLGDLQKKHPQWYKTENE